MSQMFLRQLLKLEMGKDPLFILLSSGIYTLDILRSFWYLILGSDLGFSIVLLDTRGKAHFWIWIV